MADQRYVAGRRFDAEELAMVCSVVQTCSGLSRSELSRTVCELLDWKRPGGGLKTRECNGLLDALETDGCLVLPPKRHGRRRGSHIPVPVTAAGDPRPEILGTAKDLGEVTIELVQDPAGRRLFRELIGRHHYLGYRVPFGAQLRYLVWASLPSRQPVAAVQFSSPAWRIAVRDRWIGWSDEVRKRNLQHVVSQSRFLIFPWVHVKNLGSHTLARLAGSVGSDWRNAFKVEPLVIETLVHERYPGTCYRASNWIELGQTAGRGRMDVGHRRHGAEPKTVFVLPLVHNARKRLCDG